MVSEQRPVAVYVDAGSHRGVAGRGGQAPRIVRSGWWSRVGRL